MGKILLTVLIAGAAGYLGLTCLLYFFQGRLIYFPVRKVQTTPENIGLAYEEVTLMTSDRLRLNGWLVPARQERAVVLLCHGNAGNISHRLELIRILHQLQYSVFLFDYRGYGKSEGKPGEEGTYKDATAAWEYLTRDKSYDPKRIVIMGRSLGGAVAAWLATRHQAGALILESVFTSMSDVGADHYRLLPVRLISRYGYHTRNCLGRVTVPVLVMHSRDDQIIPWRHGQALFAAANEPRQLGELSGTHNEGFLTSGEWYPNTIKNFIEKHITD